MICIKLKLRKDGVIDIGRLRRKKKFSYGFPTVSYDLMAKEIFSYGFPTVSYEPMAKEILQSSMPTRSECFVQTESFRCSVVNLLYTSRF